MDPKTFIADILDDLMRQVLEDLKKNGVANKATKGPNKERLGVSLLLKNPRARLSNSLHRGRAFSTLGESCWYLSGSEDLEFIRYYVPAYERFAQSGLLRGAYGPRLTDQLNAVVGILRSKPNTRQAVICLLKAEDVRDAESKDKPCTVSLQFFIRENRLHLLTSMRSNDAYLGLPHDIFFFTFLQEYVASLVGMALGLYQHNVGSLHLYKKDLKKAEAFISEGYQTTKAYMRKMPAITSPEILNAFLRAEESIRMGVGSDNQLTNIGSDYWDELITLLRIYKASRSGNRARAKSLVKNLNTPIFCNIVEAKLLHE